MTTSVTFPPSSRRCVAPPGFPSPPQRGAEAEAELHRIAKKLVSRASERFVSEISLPHLESATREQNPGR